MTRLLVDGNGVACRCWYASASDVPSRFKSAIERAKPSTGAEVICCWDGPGSWRLDLFPSYKSGRGPKPQALTQALEECRGIYPGWVAEGFEADDILGTLAREADEVALLLSDDKDLLQLVTAEFGRKVETPIDFRVAGLPIACLVIDSSGKVYDWDAVVDKWGVPPNRMRHLLSFMGDKVDGLPGVSGYGIKRAQAKALKGEIGNELTFELTALADVPLELMRKVGPT